MFTRRPWALALFKPVSGGGVNIASWHSPHSLTWSWILSYRPYQADENRRTLMRFWRWKDNGGPQWMLCLPWLGTVQWQRQRPMWYRDLINSERDRLSEDAREEYERGRRRGRQDVFLGVGREQ
mgnify:CR=1 FL=1